jgi:hypothetical protein
LNKQNRSDQWPPHTLLTPQQPLKIVPNPLVECPLPGTHENTKDPAPGARTKQGRRSYVPPPSPIGDDEFHDATEYTVNNKEDRVSYLTRHLLSTPDRPLDLHNISATLRQITHLPAMPLPAKEAIRAIAFILNDHAASEIVVSIISHIVTPATKQIAKEVIKATTPHIANLLHTSQSISDATNLLKSNQISLNEATRTLHDHLDHLDHLKRRQDQQSSNDPDTQMQSLDTNDIKSEISKIIPAINTSRRAIITYFNDNWNKIKEAVEKLTPPPHQSNRISKKP